MNLFNMRYHHVVVPVPCKLSYDEVEERLYLHQILDCLVTTCAVGVTLDFLRQGEDMHTTTQEILDDLTKAGLH